MVFATAIVVYSLGSHRYAAEIALFSQETPVQFHFSAHMSDYLYDSLSVLI